MHHHSIGFASEQVHRHVLERVAAFLSVPQQACARRASKALREAVRAASMEDLLRATFKYQDENKYKAADDAQLVVVTMSRTVGPPQGLLAAWSGGPLMLYEELQLRFPRAAAIGISAQLFPSTIQPFTPGPATTVSLCVVTTVASTPPAHVVESVMLAVHNPSVLARVISPDCAPCSMLCLEGVTPEQFPRMLLGIPLSSLPSLHRIEQRALYRCASLQSITLTNLPLLESLGSSSFSECTNLATVELSALPSLHSIDGRAFFHCTSLHSMSLVDLPRLEIIGDHSFSRCGRLARMELSGLPSLIVIGDGAFNCTSIQSFSFTSMPMLESFGNSFTRCVHLTNVDISGLSSLRTIGSSTFEECKLLQSVTLSNLPLLETIGTRACFGCEHLARVSFSALPSFRTIGERAFFQCESLQSVTLANLPRLESIGDSAFFGCAHLAGVELRELPSLLLIGNGAFKCTSIQSFSFASMPKLESVGNSAFSWCTHLTAVDFSGFLSLRTIGSSAFEECKSLQSVTLSNLPLLESNWR